MPADNPVIEERLDLFRWATAPERLTYLAVLAAFDDAKSSYEVQQRPVDIAVRLAAGGVPLPDDENLVRTLDSLANWGVLERSFDASRVASIEEYRRRRPLFQLSVLGERDYRAVSEVLDAREGDGQLQRFALRQITTLLTDLFEARQLADAERALGTLNQIDLVLGQLADRAAQFYVVVGSMTQQVDVDATRFVELKDLLLGHLHRFLEDLHRWTPTIAERIGQLEQAGTEQLLTMVAEADESVFLTVDQRRDRWRERWNGLVAWFGRNQRSPRITELDRRTVAGIRELTALSADCSTPRPRSKPGTRPERPRRLAVGTRRATRRRRHPRCGLQAFLEAAFGLGGARHLGVGHPDEELIAASTSWADTPPVEISLSLHERGRAPAPGTSASVPDDQRRQEQLRYIARQRLDAERAAALRLAASPLDDRVLTAEEFAALLRLTDLALAAGVPVDGMLAIGELGTVRVEIRSAPIDTMIRAEAGRMVLCGVSLQVLARVGGVGGVG